MAFDWSKVGRTPPSALGETRSLAHHAAQWVAKVAQANLKAMPDDSQSSFSWDPSYLALVSQPLPAKGGAVRMGLRIGRLELILTRGANVVDAFQFDGKTEAEAGIWVDTKMNALSLKPATGATLGYALPEHPVGGGRHRLGMLGRELAELSRWFGGPAEALEDFRGKVAAMHPGPVRCWPHHFDIATLVRLDEGTDESARAIGVGASPGDEFYSQPYVYVSPWPHFESKSLPELPLPGHWHTEGFFAAVATGDEILAMTERARALREFIEVAFELSRTGLGR